MPLQAFETGQNFEDLFSLIERISLLTCTQARGQELISSLREKLS